MSEIGLGNPLDLLEKFIEENVDSSVLLPLVLQADQLYNLLFLIIEGSSSIFEELKSKKNDEKSKFRLQLAVTAYKEIWDLLVTLLDK
jgi:hypothetical protein